MNIYTLLRLIVKGLARVNGMTNEQVFDAIELIDDLEKRAAFGTVSTVTQGKHSWRATNSMLRDEFNKCAFCGKPYAECEGEKDE